MNESTLTTFSEMVNAPFLRKVLEHAFFPPSRRGRCRTCGRFVRMYDDGPVSRYLCDHGRRKATP